MQPDCLFYVKLGSILHKGAINNTESVPVIHFVRAGIWELMALLLKTVYHESVISGSACLGKLMFQENCTCLKTTCDFTHL